MDSLLRFVSNSNGGENDLSSWDSSILGKDWEIFWEQEDEGGNDDEDNNNINISSSDNNGTTEKMDTTEDEAAERQPLSSTTATTDVSQNQVMMDIDQPEKDNNMSDEVKENNNNNAQVVGDEKKDNKDSNGVNEEDGDDDDDIEEETDWYDARVLSLVKDDNEKGRSKKKAKKITNKNETPEFRVRFVGDDSIYNMKLIPSIVRPSAKAWVRRSVALLTMISSSVIMSPSSSQQQQQQEQQKQQNDEKMVICNNNNSKDQSSTQTENKSGVVADDDDDKPLSKLLASEKKDDEKKKAAAAITFLPCDTSTLDDQKHIVKICKFFLQSKEGSEFDGKNDDDDIDQLVTKKEYNEICYLTILLRIQIYLHTQLPPLSDKFDAGEDDDDNEEEREPTKFYVTHLLEYLQIVEKACTWYCKCWVFQREVLLSSQENDELSSPANTNDGKYDIEYVGRDCLRLGRNYLTKLVNQDPSWDCAIKNHLEKRKRPASSVGALSSSSGQTRRRKRRKINNNSTSHQDSRNYMLFDNDDEAYSDNNYDVDASSNHDFVGEQRQKDVLLYRLSSESIRNFIDCVLVQQEEDKRWYVSLIANMLLHIANNIRDPIATWKDHAESILGEKPSYTKKKKSSAATASEGGSNSASGSSENDDEDESSITTMNTNQFSFDDITTCVTSASSDMVLKHFSLSKWTRRLQEKLDRIISFKEEAKDLKLRILEDPKSPPPNDDDEILSGLLALKAELQQSTSHVINISSLGISSTELDNVTKLRRWVLSLCKAEKFAEREAFIENVTSQFATFKGQLSGTNVADSSTAIQSMMPSLSLLNQTMSSRVDHLSSKLLKCYQMPSRSMRAGLMARIDDSSYENIPNLQPLVDEIRKESIVSPLDEKILVLFDIKEWNNKFDTTFSSVAPDTVVKPKYEDVVSMKKDLDNILTGKSSTRRDVVGCFESNNDVESNILTYVRANLTKWCATSSSVVYQNYTSSTDWKDRSDAIITCLRIHGNASAGEPIESNSTKNQPLIDLNRCSELLASYNNLQVLIPVQYTSLSHVVEEAKKWSDAVEGIVENASDPLLQCLPPLKSARENRPNGLLMEPARHIVDSWIECIEWYEKLRLAFEQILSMKSEWEKDPTGNSLSELLPSTLYPVLAEGLEIVELFNGNNDVRERDIFTVKASTQLLSKAYSSQRAVRSVSRSKLELSTVGRTILGDLSNGDDRHGSPLLTLSYFVWQLAAMDFIRRHSSGERQTIEDARELESARLRLFESSVKANAASDCNTNFFISFSQEVKLSEVKAFESLISNAQNNEIISKKALQSVKDISRDAFKKADDIREMLAKLRGIQAELRSKEGLLLGSTLNEIDQNVRDVAWLVKTLPYPVLHSNDAFDLNVKTPINLNAIGQKSHALPGGHDVTGGGTIPWESLVTLAERIPTSSQEPTLKNDVYVTGIAPVALRVRELFEVAKEWQEEVSRVTMLSFRGMKLRSPIASPGLSTEAKAEVTESETDKQPKLDFPTLSRLANHPILAKVSMPRESALLEVLEKARQFEGLITNLLDKDYDGKEPDRARLPISPSLIGKDGEFVLYRLTGSELYKSLQSSVRSLATVGQEVLAETPAKNAFEWLAKATSWIASLQDAVVNHSPFEEVPTERLIIRSSDAKKIIGEGRNIFLEVSDEVRKTLSTLKIHISTNRQTGRFTVVIRKAGAQQSIGGTMLRWCAFLFKSLKADLNRLKDWERRVIKIAKSIKIITAKEATDKEEIYKWYSSREKITALLLEGNDSLVLAPESSFLKSAFDLKAALEKWASRFSPGKNLDLEAFLKSRYDDSAAAVGDRFDLLDSLLTRSRKDQRKMKQVDSLVDAIVPDTVQVRNRYRSLFESAFRKGARMLGVDESTSKAKGVNAYCALKAWQFERAMRNNPMDKAKPTISHEAVRKYTSSLEDIQNPTLCAGVLMGDTTAEDVVAEISPEVRSSPTSPPVKGKNLESQSTPTKDESGGKGKGFKSLKELGSVGGILRATLKKAAPPSEKAPEPLSPPASKSTFKEEKKIAPVAVAPEVLSPQVPGGGGSIPALDDSAIRSILSSIPQVPPAVTTAVPQPVAAPPSAASAASSLNYQSSPNTGVPPMNQTMAYSTQSTLTPAAVPASNAALAVPSLVPGLQPVSTSNAANDESSEARHSASRYSNENLLTSSSGGDRFTFNFSNPDVTFTAGMILDDGVYDGGISGIIPDKITVKGRLQIDEFSKFLRGKISGGRWNAIPMKIFTYSDLDAMEYKKFYKFYESKKRIAMFAIGKETKLFLVTPKFHSTLKYLPDTFLSKSSTYAVVLSRK